jgi:hypothetical protein
MRCARHGPSQTRRNSIRTARATRRFSPSRSELPPGRRHYVTGPAELRIETGKHFPEPMKLVGAPVKVVSRPIEYVIALSKLVIE